MSMPNFFIVGAQKAGTTSLYHYLAQHPQIYMSPVKEPRFFSHEINADGEVVEKSFGDPVRRKASRFSSVHEYRALFREAKNEMAVGEATPLYIYVPGTAERIQRYVPEARIIALLRNPADRAYSAFLNARRYGGEPLTDFARALREEEERILNDWHYVFHYRNAGRYYEQIQRYYELFGREQVGVWLYEDLKSDPAGITRSVLQFLEVDDSFTPDTSSKHNPAAVPRGRFSRAVMRGMDRTATSFLEIFSPGSKIYPLASKVRRSFQSRLLVKPPRIDPKIRGELIDDYREDIIKLEKLIGRDLSVWLRDEDEDVRRATKTAELPT
jgi:hypothetical protein